MCVVGRGAAWVAQVPSEQRAGGDRPVQRHRHSRLQCHEGVQLQGGDGAAWQGLLQHHRVVVAQRREDHRLPVLARREVDRDDVGGRERQRLRRRADHVHGLAADAVDLYCRAGHGAAAERLRGGGTRTSCCSGRIRSAVSGSKGGARGGHAAATVTGCCHAVLLRLHGMQVLQCWACPRRGEAPSDCVERLWAALVHAELERDTPAVRNKLHDLHLEHREAIPRPGATQLWQLVDLLALYLKLLRGQCPGPARDQCGTLVRAMRPRLCRGRRRARRRGHRCRSGCWGRRSATRRLCRCCDGSLTAVPDLQLGNHEETAKRNRNSAEHGLTRRLLALTGYPPDRAAKDVAEPALEFATCGLPFEETAARL